MHFGQPDSSTNAYIVSGDWKTKIDILGFGLAKRAVFVHALKASSTFKHANSMRLSNGESSGDADEIAILSSLENIPISTSRYSRIQVTPIRSWQFTVLKMSIFAVQNGHRLKLTRRPVARLHAQMQALQLNTPLSTQNIIFAFSGVPPKNIALRAPPIHSS